MGRSKRNRDAFFDAAIANGSERNREKIHDGRVVKVLAEATQEGYRSAWELFEA